MRGSLGIPSYSANSFERMFGSTSHFFRRASGKKFFDRPVCSAIPAAKRKARKAARLSGPSGYSYLASPCTCTAAGIPRPSEVITAITLFFPMKERITSGLSCFQILLNRKNLSEKPAMR